MRTQQGMVRSGAYGVSVLLALLDEAFDRRSWHGTNLRGSIKGLKTAQAAWRPAPGRHSIWEEVVHAAYWKYAVRRRLTGERRGSFPYEGSNWFPRQGSDARAWRKDLEVLADEHRRLRQAVARLRPADLRRPAGSGYDLGALVRGAAAHDLYHAGQIQLLKRLQGA
jgi:uncharacterized damage-inducible protein DinB